MAKKQILLDELSSEELYQLAEKKRKEEQQRMKEKNQQKLKELRSEKRKLLKEIEQINAEIARLSGRQIRTQNKVSLSKAVLDIITKNNQISTNEIKAELAKKGLFSKNLLQTLAYLKRQGKITSPARAIYQIK